MLNLVLIHPINHTYPIASISLGNFEVNYVQASDHEEIKGAVGDIRMFDNTNYPLTIDPNKIYDSTHSYPNHEILGPRNDCESDKILEFECIMFTRPLDN